MEKTSTRTFTTTTEKNDTDTASIDLGANTRVVVHEPLEVNQIMPLVNSGSSVSDRKLNDGAKCPYCEEALKSVQIGRYKVVHIWCDDCTENMYENSHLTYARHCEERHMMADPEYDDICNR